ncbi:bifunctional helix-turn-helix domain-containing protein/methylated-DNA--[protein]-cysteine S-methyltransferase [Leptothoe kymatousa]|uniref:Methylated-DNA--[protein]-cysteine S-methyltransferase n=1 Tax=Leptothoe kymatousa TAU-MAC 1615 TaxID=2364775 RepID=A0ABS5Y6S7_9CYAN|nr:methylated-DNA--[protein]-cysteine S-methyltransferase [Leptothoe kymatousa]MBT9313517.1 methylated-DNA--[protein]-cysteine S-methyltransferase [Leptothoe kymatousa TAU-MAC 1615]
MDSFITTSAKDQETYERMANAIAFIRQHHLEQPNLATIAQHVGLSDYHFQRLFTQWAGISPKRFSQYLTLNYAKSKIAETNSLLDLTMDSGLSSPGRLHDLFVTLEAMSPGEYKSAGAGLQIRYGIHNSPFGDCLIAMTDRGICNLHFLDNPNQAVAEQQLKTEWPNATIRYEQKATEHICDQIFHRANRSPLTLHVKGTNFQIQVWQALLKIPLGGLATYQGLAKSMGKPTAARAIGNAVGRNPVGYLIPCHRVIRGSGELGGYRWGLDRKTVLVGWEASQIEAQSAFLRNPVSGKCGT